LPKCFQYGLIFLAGFVLISLPSSAQTQFGENLRVSASGTLTAGYDGSYGELIPSEHNLNFGGTGSVDGYYYSPTFASFNISPYYDQSRANSSFQSISGSSGILGSVSLFSGSHYPGSVSYSKTFDSTGTYGLQGTPNFTSHGNGQGYGIAWSALVPGLPTFSASFSGGSGSSTIYGTDAKSSSSTHNLSLRSGYDVAGFRLGASYTYGNSGGTVPGFLSGVGGERSSSSYHSETVTLAHRLPLNGSFTSNFIRSSFEIHTQGSSISDNTSDMLTANAMFRPNRKLSLTVNGTYNDNLSGSLNQELVASGGTPIASMLQSSSNSYSMSAMAGYAITQNMGASAVVTRLEQFYQGTSYGATYISGSLYYNHRLFNMFTFGATAVDAATDAGNSGGGVSGNVSFGRKFRGWDTSAAFSYGQNVQTLLVTYTTSFMNYSANVRRRLTRTLTVNTGFAGGHSGFSQQQGTTSHSESYFGSISVPRYGFSANYSSSSGVSVLTSTGLAPVTVGTIVSPFQPIVYNAHSYSFSASASPFRKLSVSSAYSNSYSNTFGSSVSSLNLTKSYVAQISYQFRRMGIMGGYNYFSQSISGANSPAAGVSSFYIGISRWVKVF